MSDADLCCKALCVVKGLGRLYKNAVYLPFKIQICFYQNRGNGMTKQSEIVMIFAHCDCFSLTWHMNRVSQAFFQLFSSGQILCLLWHFQYGEYFSTLEKKTVCYIVLKLILCQLILSQECGSCFHLLKFFLSNLFLFLFFDKSVSITLSKFPLCFLYTQIENAHHRWKPTNMSFNVVVVLKINNKKMVINCILWLYG